MQLVYFSGSGLSTVLIQSHGHTCGLWGHSCAGPVACVCPFLHVQLVGLVWKKEGVESSRLYHFHRRCVGELAGKYEREEGSAGLGRRASPRESKLLHISCTSAHIMRQGWCREKRQLLENLPKYTPGHRM